jgi:hypothetical protein
MPEHLRLGLHQALSDALQAHGADWRKIENGEKPEFFRTYHWSEWSRNITKVKSCSQAGLSVLF